MIANTWRWTSDSGRGTAGDIRAPLEGHKNRKKIHLGSPSWDIRAAWTVHIRSSHIPGAKYSLIAFLMCDLKYNIKSKNTTKVIKVIIDIICLI